MFRKVSNEIIHRCGVTINLDELFLGNVEECLEELQFSRECCIKWREVYEQNFRIMKRENRWSF